MPRHYEPGLYEPERPPPARKIATEGGGKADPAFRAEFWLALLPLLFVFWVAVFELLLG